MKKVVLLVLVIICAALCGCTTITVERRMNKDSSIEDMITVSIDETELNASGYTVEYAVSTIKGLAERNGYEIVSVDGCTVVSRKYYATQKEFQDSTPKSEKKLPSEDGFFFDVYTSETNTPFASTVSSGFIDKVRETYFPNIPLKMAENIEYVYKYSTPYSNIESNGVVTQDELYTHTWTWNANEVEVARIVMTQTIPDQTGWYLLALSAVALTLVVGLIIIALIKGKKGEKDNG